MCSADVLGANKFASLQAAIKQADQAVCGAPRLKQKSWFEDQAGIPSPLITAQNQCQAAYNCSLSPGTHNQTPDVASAKANLTGARAALRHAVSTAKNTWLDSYLDKIEAGPNRSAKTFWDAASMLKRGIGNTKPAVVIKMKKNDGSLCNSEAENAEVFQAHFERLYNNVTL